MLIFKVYFFLLRTEMQKKKSKKILYSPNTCISFDIDIQNCTIEKPKIHWEFLYIKINDLDIKKCGNYLLIQVHVTN